MKINYEYNELSQRLLVHLKSILHKINSLIRSAVFVHIRNTKWQCWRENSLDEYVLLSTVDFLQLQETHKYFKGNRCRVNHLKRGCQLDGYNNSNIEQRHIEKHCIDISLLCTHTMNPCSVKNDDVKYIFQSATEWTSFVSLGMEVTNSKVDLQAFHVA